jgi:hypothetical protein
LHAASVPALAKSKLKRAAADARRVASSNA